MKANQKGFTLIELVMVIVVLAILGGVAIPQFVNLRADACGANEAGVAGGVRAAILTFFIDPTRGNRQIYPANLDGALPNTDCTTLSPCFNAILTTNGLMGQGITDSTWKTLTGVGGRPAYRSCASATNVWIYNSADGSFNKTAN